MNSDTLRTWLRAEPFAPFSITLSNGNTYEVRHPELLIVGRHVAAVGISADPDTLDFERLVNLSLRQIASIEPLNSNLGGTDKS